ncbi:MAG: hypothetical protein R3244_03435 [Thermoanaerobaculia bacterium]|nr:hypothetical protein [Thermoanaerobaculia bacterium]
MRFESLSPVINVEEIEPCLPFWTERLGFALVAQVSHDARLGFAMLVRDDLSVMYQSFAAAEADVPGVVAHDQPPGTGLFFVVSDFDALLKALEGAEVVVPERQTSYAEREIAVRAPCGTIVGFAFGLDD